MKQKYKRKPIVGTLKYGEVDGMNKISYYIIAIIDILIFAGAGVALIVISTINNMETGHSGAWLGCIPLFCFAGVLIWIFINNEKHRKKIKLWLADAVELEAYARQMCPLKQDHVFDKITGFGRYKICVEFEYEGRRYARESRGGGSRQHPEDVGFHRVWRKYVNKKIDILYSPKYEEVMILKFNRRKEKVDTSKETAKIDSPPSDNDTPQA